MLVRFLLSLWFLVALIGPSQSMICTDSASLRSCIQSSSEVVCTIATAWTNPDISQTAHTSGTNKLINTESGEVVTLTLNDGFLGFDTAIVTVENLNITKNPVGAPALLYPVFQLGNLAQFHLRNVHIHDITSSAVAWGQWGTGSWTNVTVSNFVSIRTQYAAHPFFVADTEWNFTDVTWSNITLSPGTSLFRMTQSASVGIQYTFAGDQIFENIHSSDSQPSTSIISMQQESDPANLGPLNILSDEQKPSKFVVRDSEMPLLSSHARTPNTIFKATFGSIDIQSSGNSPLNNTLAHAFSLDALNSSSPSSQFSLKIIGDAIVNGMGFLSRGPITYEGYAFDDTMDVSIGGDLNLTVPSTAPSVFRLNWPASIQASSISINLEKMSETDLTAPVVFQQDLDLYSSELFIAHSTISASNAFTITSDPTYSIPSGSLFNVALNNTMLTLKAGDTFSVSGVTRSTSMTSYNASYHGTVASVENGGRMEIITNGSMTFSSNDNKFGAGGVFYIGNSLATSAHPVLKLQTTTDGDIEFNGNTAWFAGVIYAAEDTPSSAIEVSVVSSTTSTRPIRFISNEAKNAGGVALLPQQLVSSLVPSGRTLFSENGAFDFGCLFAYAETFTASDAGGNCPSALNAQYFGNFNLSSGYQWATECTDLDSICRPPSPPTATVPCPNPAPFGANCVNGKWIVNGTSLPSSFQVGVPVVIVGNVTVPSITVRNVLQFKDAMINSEDCIVVKHLTIQMSEEDVEKLEKDGKTSATLIKSSCSTSGTQLTIDKIKTKKSCQKVKSTRSDSKGSLIVTFTLDKSDCNRWWIILVSVVGAVILLVIIFVVVILLLPTHYRAQLQPFHKTQDAPTARTSTYTKVN